MADWITRLEARMIRNEIKALPIPQTLNEADRYNALLNRLKEITMET